eukprot:CAMPEP_0183716440 /NCGR_PEP_ID=MMETSP0737-20130205/10363_1 /TAXON_ID=385413 /ORGANISM="Thalassiosira miniscula, Strain CCMP1093" /LENGTH=759 /DNA_ID=CAMNT_0025945717 /DNA_START=4 /DNA_END=2280 /DNA_ORIENTATION=+
MTVVSDDGRLEIKDENSSNNEPRSKKLKTTATTEENLRPVSAAAVSADHGETTPPGPTTNNERDVNNNNNGDSSSSHPRSHSHHHNSQSSSSSRLCCAGCGVNESSAALLLFEDPENDDAAAAANDDGKEKKKKPQDEKRYCAGCMTGKKVRVFWPVDSQWYIADVQQYDPHTGEHLLCYPDGDTEWVRIGEDHTTNTQYKEYFSSLKNTDAGTTGPNAATEGNPLTRMPSLGNGGVSFALSAMSQSFGIPTAADHAAEEKANTMRLKHPSQQQRLFQQLNLDRTQSSMSSFGMYPGNGGRQPSFGGQHHQQQHQQQHSNGRAPPFQILSPNYTHSFSSKIGTVNSMDFGPPPPNHNGKGGSNGPPPPPLPYPHHAPLHQQQREEGSASNLSSTSPGTRDGAPGSSHHPWPHSQYSNPSYYDNGAPPQMMYPYSVSQPPSDPSYDATSKQPKAPPSSASPKSSRSPHSDKMAKSRKALAKAWTKAEDEHLLDLVLEMKHPLKWSVIASSLADFVEARNPDTPERTGKQCRERYVNHLNPRLKHTEFTPTEDATIWRFYATIGTQWAKMSKVIPGRTDNNLKNRFHNLKRQLQREEESRLRAPTSPEEMEERIHVDRVREVPAFLRTKIEEMWNHQRNIGMVAAASFVGPDSREDDNEGTSMNDDNGEKDGESVSMDLQKFRKYGPYEKVVEPTQCGRCGLFLPSVQCGDEICTKTRWCRVCTKVSMHLSGNVLRECVNLRKSENDNELGMEKLLMAEVW